MQPQKSLRPFPTVSPGRIHLAALLHVVDRLERDGGQSAAGERREEEEDDKQGVASRVTNTRGGYGWAAASFRVGDSPHLALDGDGDAGSSERVAVRGVPCGAGRDALPAALAAAEAAAGVGDVHGLGYGVDEDVGGVAAGLAGCDDRAHAVGSHSCEGHGRPWRGAHGRARR